MVSVWRNRRKSLPARRAPGRASFVLRFALGSMGWSARLMAPGLPVLAACATAPGTPGTQVVESERTVLDLRGKNAAYVRRIEELENRIFILEDQLDSRKLAAEQRAPATLPALALGHVGDAAVVSRPTPPKGLADSASDTPATGSDDMVPTGETSIVAEHSVDYTGDAAQPPPALGFHTAQSASSWAHSGRPQLRLPAITDQRAPAGRALVQPAVAHVHGPEPLPEFRLQAGPAATGDPLITYRQALETLRAGQPAVALVGFRKFLAANPEHDYADNAQYWMGECLYDQRQLHAAERAFRKVVEGYPRGNKVPDAMLKLGFTLQALGDGPRGRAVLESLARAFPKHDAARLASARLAHPQTATYTDGTHPAAGVTLTAPLPAPRGSRQSGHSRKPYPVPAVRP